MDGKRLCILLISLVAGILTGNLSAIQPEASLIPIVISAVLLLAGIFITRDNPFRRIPYLHEAIIALLFYGVGLFSITLTKPSQTHFEKGYYTFSGRISDYTVTNNGDKLLIDISNLVMENSGMPMLEVRNIKALVTLKGESKASYGTIITGKAMLYPIDMPGNYYNKDYTDFLKNQQIFLTGYSDISDCRLEKHGSVNSFFQTLRYDLETGIEQTPLAPDTKNFLISVLLGDKSYLSHSERMTFADAGVSHIFAVSGFHVSMIGTFLLVVISIFFFGNKRHLKFLICIPCIWFYILLVGMSPSTCRAGIMLSISLTAAALQRKNDPLRALGWACILILSFYPRALFDIGFQLSVSCVGCLILFVEKLNFINHRLHPWIYKAVGVVLVTVVAALSSWIICAFYFHRFSLMFLPLNIIAVPALPAFLLLSLIYLFLFGVHIDFKILGHIIDGSFSMFKSSASFLSQLSLPFTDLHPNALSLILWFAALLMAGYILHCKSSKRLLWLPAITLCLSLLTFIMIPTSLPKGMIMQKKSDKTDIMYYNEGKEQLIEIPMTGISKLNLHGKNIVAVNTPEVTAESLPELAKADIIILGKGLKTLPDEIAASVSGNCRIVTHPSLHWRYERKIIDEAKERNLPVHSIRYDGPLHIFEE